MGKKYNNKSGVTGVQRQSKISPRWIASIAYKYKSIWLGVDEDFDNVVVLRLRGEAQYFKEYLPNYNQQTNSLCLKYVSQTDYKTHYIEMSMNGDIIQNKILEEGCNDN